MRDKRPISSETALSSHKATQLTEVNDSALSDMAKAVVAAAGWTPEVMGQYLADVTGTLRDAMQADKVQHFAHQGEVKETRTDADHSTRIRAAAELGSLLLHIGQLRGNQGGQQGGTSITFNIPWVEQVKEMMDVTPKQGEPSPPCTP